ncbi:MAG: Gfo/Idh/MocA family oxidoreductase [Planctomycetota bacterium]|nr:Gfo/Idh/MocA family oxidoreductase [Planctomycetota bacterium]
MIRVGIAGLGFMGMTHFRAIRRLKGLRVDAIATRDPKKRAGDWRSIQGNFGARGGIENLSKIRAYEDLGDMLADPKLDLIDICLPTAQHAEVTLAALKAGKHVLLEKPISTDLKEGERMAAAARAAGKRLLIAHVLPFFPDYFQALKLVRSGKFGKVLAAHFKRVISKPDWSKDAQDGRKSGGPAIDLHIHDTHFIQLLTGTPKAVFARGIEAGGAVQYLDTTYVYERGGPMVTCSSGGICMRGRSFTHGFEIYLERGSLLFEWATMGGKPRAVMPLTLLTPDGKAKPLSKGPADPVKAFEAEIKYAADALNGRCDGEWLSAESALAALRLCHREIASVRSGRTERV